MPSREGARARRAIEHVRIGLADRRDPSRRGVVTSAWRPRNSRSSSRFLRTGACERRAGTLRQSPLLTGCRGRVARTHPARWSRRGGRTFGRRRLDARDRGSPGRRGWRYSARATRTDTARRLRGAGDARARRRHDGELAERAPDQRLDGHPGPGSSRAVMTRPRPRRPRRGADRADGWLPPPRPAAAISLLDVIDAVEPEPEPRTLRPARRPVRASTACAPSMTRSTAARTSMSERLADVSLADVSAHSPT